VDETLARLEQLDPQQARVVDLRYFGGLSVEETPEAMEISALHDPTNRQAEKTRRASNVAGWAAQLLHVPYVHQNNEKQKFWKWAFGVDFRARTRLVHNHAPHLLGGRFSQLSGAGTADWRTVRSPARWVAA
jgi:hypothetical protein